jgi:hypothetical protein
MKEQTTLPMQSAFKKGIPKITKWVYAMVIVIFVIVQSVPFAYFADVISEDTTYNITVFKCVRYNELDIAAAE